MKAWLIIVLAIELLLAVGLASYGHVNQIPIRKASREFHDNPNETTKAELNRQLRIERNARIVNGVTSFASMAGVTFAALFMVGYLQSRKRENRDSTES